MDAEQTTPAPVAGAETVAPAVTATTTSSTAATPGAEPTSLEDAKQLIARLLKDKQDANKEAQKLHERVKAIDDAAEQERKAKLGETERLREEKAQLEAQLKASQITGWKAQAAVKHGLTGDATKFLAGDTEEAIEANAAELAKLVSRAPSLSPGATAQGAGGNPAETYDQRMRRIYGGGGGEIWTNPTAFGGGVFMPGETE